MNPGASAQGGVGVGLMTAAGNPWTVADALAQTLVNGGLATAYNWPAGAVSPLSGTEITQIRGVVSGALIPITGLQLGTSALVRAMNAVTAAAALSVSGTYALPVGDYSFDPFTVSASVIVQGQGANNTWSPVTVSPTVAEGIASGETANTILRFATTTADAITVNAPGCVFRNFHVMGAQNATSGALWRFGAAGVSADGWKIHDCSAKWGYIQVRNTNGAGYTLRDNYLLGARGNALYVENVANVDYGDPSITGNSFIAIYKAAAAIYVKGGGGLKIVGNKFCWASLAFTDYTTYNWTRHVHIDNPNGLTSVLVLTGNSMEVCDKESVLVDCSTSGSYGNILITSNQISFAGAAVGEATVTVRGRAANPIGHLTVDANGFSSCRFIKIAYIKSGNIGKNVWQIPGGAGPFVEKGAGCSGVDIEPQACGDMQVNSTLFLATDATNDWNSITTQRGNDRHHYVRDVPNVASNSAYTDLYQIWIPEYASCNFDVTLNCSSSSNGQASMTARRMFATEYQSPVLGIVGADAGIARVSGTTAVQTISASVTNPICGDLDLKFTTGNTGIGGGCYVNISVKRSASAAGTALVGTITLAIEGAVNKVNRVN